MAEFVNLYINRIDVNITYKNYDLYFFGYMSRSFDLNYEYI
jgi:hypothetical protein